MNSPMKPSLDHEIDSDPVWDLVDQVPRIEPSPTFVEDTLRRARLADHTPSPWWNSLPFSKSVLGAAAACCAVAIILICLKSGSTDTSPPFTEIPETEIIELEDVIATELLIAAADDPDLMSDAELLSLLF